MRDPAQRVTLCFASVSRPHCLQRLITSARARYPTLRIIVAEQCDSESKLKNFYRENNIDVVMLPANAGVSRARNAAVKRVETEYILLADDDFIIGPEMDLSIPLRVLDKSNEVDILGGCLYDIFGELDFSNYYVRRWERIFTLDRGSRSLISIGIDDIFPVKKGTDANPYFHCDAVMNWAVMRTNIFSRGAKWDERFICNGEHEDFYLNIKMNTDIRVGYVPEFVAYHHHPHDNQYSAQRHKQEGWRLLGEKWDLENYYNPPSGFHLFSEGQALFNSSATLNEFVSRAGVLPTPSYVSASFSVGGVATVRGPNEDQNVDALISNRGNVHFVDKKNGVDKNSWPVNKFELAMLPDIRCLSVEILVAEKKLTVVAGDKITIPVVTKNNSGKKIGVISAQHRFSLGTRVRFSEHSTSDAQLTSMINDVDNVAYQYVNLDLEMAPGEYQLEVDFWLDSVGWLQRPDVLSLHVTERPESEI